MNNNNKILNDLIKKSICSLYIKFLYVTNYQEITSFMLLVATLTGHKY
jgi:hypothetical protein